LSDSTGGGPKRKLFEPALVISFNLVVDMRRLGYMNGGRILYLLDFCLVDAGGVKRDL